MNIREFFNLDEKKVIFEEKQEKNIEPKKQAILKALFNGQESIYYDAKANPDINAFRGSKIQKISSKPGYNEFITQIKTLIDGIVKAIEDKKLLPEKQAYVKKVWQDFYEKLADPDLLSADVIFPFFEKGKKHLEEIYYNSMINSEKTSVKELIKGLHVPGILDMCGTGTFTKLKAVAKSLQNPGLTIQDHFYQAVEHAIESKIAAFYNDCMLDNYDLCTSGNEVHYVNIMLDHLIDLKVLPITLKNRNDSFSFDLPPVPEFLLLELRKEISEGSEIVNDIIRELINKYYSMVKDVSTYDEANHFIKKISSDEEPKLYEQKFSDLFALYEKDNNNNYIIDEASISINIKPLDQIKETSDSPGTIKTTAQIKEVLKISILFKLCEKHIVSPKNLFGYIVSRNIILSPMIIRFLYNVGADINIPIYGGLTALGVAVIIEQTDVVKALIDVKAKGSSGLYFDPKEKRYRDLVPAHWFNAVLKPTPYFDFSIWDSIPNKSLQDVLFPLLNELSEENINLLLNKINPVQIVEMTKEEGYALAFVKLDRDKQKLLFRKIATKTNMKESPLLNLPRFFQNQVLAFLGNKVGGNTFQAVRRDYKIEDKFKGTLTRTTTLFSNIHVLNKRLTERIAHNLLFHENIEATLEVVRNNQQCLYIEVELKDPHGQRVCNHLVGILSSAGDRNTREMKLGEKPDGLVERLGACFKNPDDFKIQRENWEKNCEAATAITMAPYREAIETVCQEIIDSKEIPNVDYNDVTDDQFEAFLHLSFAQKFRNALKPNPYYVVRAGFLFDMKIFLDAIEIFKRKVGNEDQENTLRGWSTLKSHIFDAIVYSALQFRSERCDHKIFKKGIGNVVYKKQSPDSDNYTAVFSRSDLSGFGVTHFFGYDGQKLPGSYAWMAGVSVVGEAFQILCQAKRQLHSIYQPALTKQHRQLRQQLFQAVVDGDIEIIKRILDANLGLLLDKSKEDLVIQSQLTWDIFNLKDENVFTVAAKRRQIKILELLSSYINKLQGDTLIESIKKEVLSKWPSYEHKEKKGEFDIPTDYIVELKKMVKVFKDETFPNGTGVNAKISKETELALRQFRDKILPKKAVTLDESIQPELFLYAALKIYYDCFNDFNNWDQRDAYCKEIIGPAQRRLTREDAIPWCQGIYYVVEESQAISDRARALKLLDGENFYLLQPDFASGLSGQYFAGSEGWGISAAGVVARWVAALEKLCQAKTAACRDLCEAQTIGHALKIV